MLDVRTILKMKKQFGGALKQYSKCYNIICHFKPHSLHVWQIIIFPYLISEHIKFQVFLSTGGIFDFFCSVTSYSLSIEQRFLDEQFVSSVNDTGFAWYSKCVGDNAGIKFIFHLKYDKGRIFNPSLKPFELNTELVCADGSVTPFMPLSPLKEQKSSRARINPL